MIDVGAISGFINHLVIFFALFGLPLAAIGAFVAFFIFKDFKHATDTTGPDELLKKAVADHEAMLAAVEEQHGMALNHLKEQREGQVLSIQRETIAKLERLMADCATDGMPDDLKASAEAILRMDPDNEKAKGYVASLA